VRAIKPQPNCDPFRNPFVVLPHHAGTATRGEDITDTGRAGALYCARCQPLLSIVAFQAKIRSNGMCLNLPTQERKCRKHCEHNEWSVLRVFTDAGESARTADRPQLQEMLAFCRQNKGKVTHVVVADLSRLATAGSETKAMESGEVFDLPTAC